MALTTLSAAGAKWRASEWQSAITELRPLTAVKTSNEIVNNSATLQADNELFLAVEASRVYEMDMHLVYRSNATPDLKFQFTGPTLSTLTYGGVYLESTALAITLGAIYTLASVVVVGGNGADLHATFDGTFTTGANAGTLALTWAQNSANVSDSTIYGPGSYLALRLVS